MNFGSIKTYKLQINQKQISVNIRKEKKVRNLSLRIVSNEELSMVVPVLMTEKYCFDFIERKKNWIIKNLRKFDLDQEEFFLGEKLTVKIDDTMKGNFNYNSAEKILVIKEKSGYDLFIYEYAKKYLPDYIRKVAQKNSFTINRISIRKQKTRWGSCSAGKNISINYKLLKYSPDIINYVIFHELCHTIEMNHSFRFWNLIAKYVQNYQECRLKLKNRIYK